MGRAGVYMSDPLPELLHRPEFQLGEMNSLTSLTQSGLPHAQT